MSSDGVGLVSVVQFRRWPFGTSRGTGLVVNGTVLASLLGQIIRTHSTTLTQLIQNSNQNPEARQRQKLATPIPEFGRPNKQILVVVKATRYY